MNNLKRFGIIVCTPGGLSHCAKLLFLLGRKKYGNGSYDGDPTVPPQFNCEKCGGAMYPEFYKGLHGYEYKISDLGER